MKSANTAMLARNVTLKLLDYCRSSEWAGYDPYDALNSEVFKALPILDSRITRLVFTQLLKRVPFNFRRLLRIPKTQNAKGVSLFLAGLVKLSRTGLAGQNNLIGYMIERLKALRSTGTTYWCWGYSFPWQTRTILVPKAEPNLVCTTFVANALLDAYEETNESELLEIAVSAAEFIKNELYWTRGESMACFAYPFSDSRQTIHNANLLGAALLCRVSRLAGERKFLEPALCVARYSANKQRLNGSWPYGELPTQEWIDNFHTGFNLTALRDLTRYTESPEYEDRARQGFKFYQKHFFREDGAPRYFHDRTFPIDAHCVAQSIITLINFDDIFPENREHAQSVFKWAINRMWNEKGYFYYQKLPFYTIKIPYMRWSLSWMFLALCILLENLSQK